MATAIGVIGSALTIFSFLQDAFPAPDAPTTKLRVAVGLDGTQGLSNAGGDAPDVRLFNENLGFINAAYDPGHIGNGGFRDINIDQDTSQQPTFALLTGNDDAICIAYLSETWPDGQNYAWVGNWGHHCGQSWYYSNVYIDDKALDCTWLDSNGDATDVTAFHVHFPEFNDKGMGYNSNPDYYCNSVRALNFQYTSDPGTIYTKRDLDLNVNNSTTDAEKPRRSSHYKDTRLIKSTAPEHSAIDLCASETSVGPSFVSLAERVYCDMETKTTLPLCGGVEGDCFNADTNLPQLVAGVSRIASAGFSSILEWGPK